MSCRIAKCNESAGAHGACDTCRERVLKVGKQSATLPEWLAALEEDEALMVEDIIRPSMLADAAAREAFDEPLIRR